MTPQITFSDIDGTLLNADREPSPALKTEVARLTEKGIPFILISSRMPQAMTWIQDELGISGLPLVAYNGNYLHLYRSKDDYLEIASKEISKLTGINKVLELKYPDLTPADCVAFGDNYNDIEMLRGVGLGVAVANAKPEVLAVADRTTDAAKEDGVAKALREYR